MICWYTWTLQFGSSVTGCQITIWHPSGSVVRWLARVLGKVLIFSPTEIVVFQEVHMGAEDDDVVVVVVVVAVAVAVAVVVVVVAVAVAVAVAVVVVVTVLLLCFLSSLKFHQFGHDFVQLKASLLVDSHK